MNKQKRSASSTPPTPRDRPPGERAESTTRTSTHTVAEVTQTVKLAQVTRALPRVSASPNGARRYDAIGAILKLLAANLKHQSGPPDIVRPLTPTLSVRVLLPIRFPDGMPIPLEMLASIVGDLVPDVSTGATIGIVGGCCVDETVEIDELLSVDLAVRKRSVHEIAARLQPWCSRLEQRELFLTVAPASIIRITGHRALHTST